MVNVLSNANPDKVFNEAQAKITEIQGRQSEFDSDTWTAIQPTIDKLNQAIESRNESEAASLTQMLGQYDTDMRYAMMNTEDEGGWTETTTRGAKGMTYLEPEEKEEENPYNTPGEIINSIGNVLSSGIQGFLSDERLKKTSGGSRVPDSKDIDAAMDKLMGVK